VLVGLLVQPAVNAELRGDQKQLVAARGPEGSGLVLEAGAPGKLLRLMQLAAKSGDIC
jgi:hypothetical protein